MVRVVEAKQKHVPEMVEIWREFIDFHVERDPIYARSDDAHHFFEKYLKGFMESEESQVLVALDGKQVVGYSIARVAHHSPVFQPRIYGDITEIAVKKEYRRRSIGEVLLSKMKKWFTQQGINRIETRVSTRNEVACLFWKKHGFQRYLDDLCLEI